MVAAMLKPLDYSTFYMTNKYILDIKTMNNFLSIFLRNKMMHRTAMVNEVMFQMSH